MFSMNYMAKRQRAWLTQAIGMGLQVGATIGNNIDLGRTRRRLDGYKKTDPIYAESDYAKRQYGTAANAYNGRMDGAAQLEQNINANQANTIGTINRGASDASTALSLASASQGQTNQALQNLQINEAQDKNVKLANLNSAYGAMTDEHTKSFDDSVRRWQDDLGIMMKKSEIRSQQWGNMNNLGQSISGAGTMGFGGGK